MLFELCAMNFDCGYLEKVKNEEGVKKDHWESHNKTIKV